MSSRYSKRLHIHMLTPEELAAIEAREKKLRRLGLGIILGVIVIGAAIWFSWNYIASLWQSDTTAPEPESPGTTTPFSWVVLASFVCGVGLLWTRQKLAGWVAVGIALLLVFYYLGMSFLLGILISTCFAIGTTVLKAKKSYDFWGWTCIAAAVHMSLFTISNVFISLFLWFCFNAQPWFWLNDVLFAAWGVSFFSCFSSKQVTEGKIGQMTLLNKWITWGSNIPPGITCLPVPFKWVVKVDAKSATSVVAFLGGKEKTPVPIQTGANGTEFTAMIEARFKYKLIHTAKALLSPVKPEALTEIVKAAITAFLADPTLTEVSQIRSRKAELAKNSREFAQQAFFDLGYELEEFLLIEAEDEKSVVAARTALKTGVLLEARDRQETQGLIQRAIELMSADPHGTMKYPEALRMAQVEAGKRKAEEIRVTGKGGGRNLFSHHD